MKIRPSHRPRTVCRRHCCQNAFIGKRKQSPMRSVPKSNQMSRGDHLTKDIVKQHSLRSCRIATTTELRSNGTVFCMASTRGPSFDKLQKQIGYKNMCQIKFANRISWVTRKSAPQKNEMISDMWSDVSFGNFPSITPKATILYAFGRCFRASSAFSSRLSTCAFHKFR